MESKDYTLVNNLFYKNSSCKGVYLEDTRCPLIGENQVRSVFSFNGKITVHMRVYNVKKKDQEE